LYYGAYYGALSAGDLRHPVRGAPGGYGRMGDQNGKPPLTRRVPGATRAAPADPERRKPPELPEPMRRRIQAVVSAAHAREVQTQHEQKRSEGPPENGSSPAHTPLRRAGADLAENELASSGPSMPPQRPAGQLLYVDAEFDTAPIPRLTASGAVADQRERARENLRERAEQERARQEQLERAAGEERARQERAMAEARAKQARVKLEQERIRLEQERAAAQERARQEQERAEAERAGLEARERAAAEERARRERERTAREERKHAAKQERAAQRQQAAERKHAAKAERERAAQERAEQQRAEQEQVRLAEQRAAEERAGQEKERARQEKERARQEEERGARERLRQEQELEDREWAARRRARLEQLREEAEERARREQERAALTNGSDHSGQLGSPPSTARPGRAAELAARGPTPVVAAPDQRRQPQQEAEPEQKEPQQKEPQQKEPQRKAEQDQKSQQALRTRPPQGEFERLRRYRAPAAVAAAVALVAGGSLAVAHAAHISHAPVVSAATALENTAASWVVQQVAPSAIISCDAVMCQALRAHGVPTNDLIALGSDTANLLQSRIVVATPDIRNQLGSRLTTVYAPAVIASFGSGKKRIDIRVIAPHGAGRYLSQLSADQQDRKTIGTALLGYGRFTVSSTARQQLASGQVDSRLILVLSNMTTSVSQLSIAAFGDSGPGATAGMPLRSATLTGSRAILSSIAAFLKTQQGQFRPAHIEMTQFDRKPALVFEFTAPSPLELF
jgi:hypothetical protein